jgi:hypothetical protein
MKQYTAQLSDNTFSLGNDGYASGKELLGSNTGGYVPHMGMKASSGTQTWRTRSNRKTAKC